MNERSEQLHRRLAKLALIEEVFPQTEVWMRREERWKPVKFLLEEYPQ